MPFAALGTKDDDAREDGIREFGGWFDGVAEDAARDAAAWFDTG